MKSKKKKVQEVLDALDGKLNLVKVFPIYPRYPNRVRLQWPELNFWFVAKNRSESMVSICIYLPSNWIYLLNVYVRLSGKKSLLLDRIRWKLEEWGL
jgi:hypothetical protein